MWSNTKLSEFAEGLLCLVTLLNVHDVPVESSFVVQFSPNVFLYTSAALSRTFSQYMCFVVDGSEVLKSWEDR